ncbi:hypothetical protein [Streptomyces xinghaiensis]|uniref:hypothetical protein n=1 Tax=Streptomyces xinghaiensis TaxID=1038928 RepID=UPI00344732C8
MEIRVGESFIAGLDFSRHALMAARTFRNEFVTLKLESTHAAEDSDFVGRSPVV